LDQGTIGTWNVFNRKSLIATTVLVLLMSVPASAITFIGGWRISQSQNLAPPATTTPTDFVNGSRLRVDMKKVVKKRFPESIVTAVRNFSIGAGGETVQLTHSFATLLENANLTSSVVVRGLTSGSTKEFRLTDLDLRNGNFNISQSLSQLLATGTYQIAIRLKYRGLSAESSWNNASPHTFTIAGM
jgi:hypothetical protein